MAAMSRTLVFLLLTGAAAVRHIDEENTAVALDGITEKSLAPDSEKCYEACDCDHIAEPDISVSKECPPCLRELGMHFTRHGNLENEARDAYCAQNAYTTSTTTAVLETTAGVTSDCNSVCDCENFDEPALGIEAECKPCLEKLGKRVNHHEPFYKVRDSYCAPTTETTSIATTETTETTTTTTTTKTETTTTITTTTTTTTPTTSTSEATTTTTTTTTAMAETEADCNSVCDCENFDQPALGIEAECKPCLEKLGKHVNHHEPFYKVRDSYCAPTTETTSIATTETTETTTTTTTTKTETTTTVTTTTTTTKTETTSTTTTTTTTIATTSTSEVPTTTTSTSGAHNLFIHASSLLASLMSLFMFN